ncbi:ABC transporter ATP-binding protein [Rivibacter subsaxonicus]|uniref:Carbohydrate ABC transporter ATP-binding protein (CUT1 family) n=1 Tax=Rivibacter subsaxonicus TaxID=457575 RepID=A0A4Q7W0F3_9BURK|nr:ABC transporter ATP-binding protein [Rivibacter subsaxonicus]RZU02295.1 carbohydrate ABC transporter ATP-binding protein (CUT1 family) [Rivibacter subsaxonicus]
MAEILIERLHKRFGDFVAVHDSSLRLEDGKFVVLLGPSGCGKTTTLRMLAGLEYPSSGSITLDGQDVTYLRPRERDIAMVFQLFALYPHLGVRGNLEFPLRNEGLPRAEIDSRVRDVGAILRIEHLLASRIGSLSGGDRQRVALGRAIVRQPKAFLMDEPLGTLDAEFRELMCVELRKLHDRLRTTTVFVTHDQNEAMALADQIVVMHEGCILQCDDPAGIYHFPNCLFVAGFIGRPPMNTLRVEGAVQPGAESVLLAGSAVPVPRVEATAATALLGVRPEHVRLANPSGTTLAGEVVQVEYFGSHWIAELSTAAGSLKAMVDKALRPRPGERVGIEFERARVLLFDASSGQRLASATTRAHDEGRRHGQR